MLTKSQPNLGAMRCKEVSLSDYCFFALTYPQFNRILPILAHNLRRIDIYSIGIAP